MYTARWGESAAAAARCARAASGEASAASIALLKILRPGRWDDCIYSSVIATLYRDLEKNAGAQGARDTT